MTNPLILVGEAFGEQEEMFGRPFVGAAGQELFRMLGHAGFPLPPLPYNFISSSTMDYKWKSFSYPRTNVFAARPPANNIEEFYAGLRDTTPIDKTLPVRKFGSSNKWVCEEQAHHVHSLHERLASLKPNLTIALGATACWALGLGGGIGKLRGFIHETPWGKVLPIYHPAAVLRNWSLRPLCILDFAKARREMEFSEVRITPREIWTEPTIADLYTWWDIYGQSSPLIAIDIETLRRTQISEVGFASDSQHALHIPFCIETKTDQRWWPDAATEVEAWKFVYKVCTSPNPKVLQNGKYDTYWLAKEMHIPVLNWHHDTLQAQHVYQPEFGKSLYDLGAIYLDERSWKSIRKSVEKDND